MKSVQKYAVMLYGSNYLFAKDNVPPRKYAFFVWRCVEADSKAEAEAIALQRVRDYPYDSCFICNAEDDPPVLQVKEVREGYGDLQPPGSGYIYFGEGDDEEPPKGFFAKLRRKFSRVTYREW
ncbi:MAG: hypothetical protein NT023_05015 [Armatimonadetes bacterium]|nr:hypothetical protein [Armatimonadota bacterium]